MACNIELLNIYKKDDFNKDIVPTSHYLKIITVSKNSSHYLRNPEKSGIPDKISNFTQNDSRITVSKK
jgi:hypothetical protein